MRIDRRNFLAAGTSLAALPLALPLASRAQPAPESFPTRAIRVVTPFPAGSIFDAVGRRLGDSLAARLKSPVVVDNKPGGGGSISALEVLRAAPDGHTLLLTVADPVVTTPATMRVSYNPAEFTPISKLVRSYPVLLINTNRQSSTLQALAEEARQATQPLTYGSFGPGSFPQLVLESVASKAGIKLVNIPYRGVPQALNDMLSNEIALAFAAPSQALPHIAQGRVRALAVMGAARTPAMPTVPTFAESGHDNFFTRRDSWLGLLGPARMPAPLVEQVRTLFAAVLQEPEMVKWLATLDLSLGLSASPAQFRRDVEAEMQTVARYIRQELKLQPQELSN